MLEVLNISLKLTWNCIHGSFVVERSYVSVICFPLVMLHELHTFHLLMEYRPNALLTV